jgi:transposase-like protein
MAMIVSSVTPAPTQSSSSGTQSAPAERKATRSPRRLLSEDQKREIVRLYAKTDTPLAAIKQQFSIAESSLYRLIQQRGVAPRGRIPVTPQSVSNSGRRSALNGDMAVSRQSARSRSSVSRRPIRLTSPSTESGVKYRVTFAALQIVTAVDMRDALRQAEALGAAEISAIVRSE